MLAAKDTTEAAAATARVRRPSIAGENQARMRTGTAAFAVTARILEQPGDYFFVMGPLGFEPRTKGL